MREVEMPTQEDLNTLHDAELAALSIDRANESLDIVLVRVDGLRIGLKFGGVKVFRSSSLLFQNVVYSAALSSLGHLARADVKRVVAMACTLDGEQRLEGEPARFKATTISSLVDKIIDGSLLMFQVEASWGAEIVVIGEAIAWYQPAA